MTASCPDLWPRTNQAYRMVTPCEWALQRSRFTWRAVTAFLVSMSVRGMEQVGSLFIQREKGYIERMVFSTEQSTTKRKWQSASCEYIALIGQKGQLATRSFFIQCFNTMPLPYYFSMFIRYHLISYMQSPIVGMTMHMTVKWGWRISFVFEQFTVEEDQTGLIFLGMILTLAISILSVALPALKSSITSRIFTKEQGENPLLNRSEEEETKDKQGNSKQQVLFDFFYILIYSIMQILSMMLIMTYNGYVIIAVIIGLTIGYTIFGMESDKDKSIPVNCCA